MGLNKKGLQLYTTMYIMASMDKIIRVDQEVKDLLLEYISALKKEQGIKYSQGSALKLALRKVLLK